MAPNVDTGRVPDEMFGGYADVVTLAGGVHSTVHRATELATGRPVALKVLNVDGTSPGELEAFARESAVLSALGAHPNIVTLYDSFALPDGRPVLVLELCEGSLAQRLAATREQEPIPASEAVSIAAKLAGALETAHRAGVLHRAVRPENVLITAYGEPALSDFGLSRLRGTPVSATAELFDFPGPHVAPELMLGQEASEATDVYGLASLLYQLLTGAPPMAAYAGETPSATILRILRDPARPIDDPRVPYALSDLLLWGLAKEPAQRPPSAAWFAEELARVEARSGWTRTSSLVGESAGPVKARTIRRHAVRLHRADRAPAGTRSAFGSSSAPAPLQPTPVARLRTAVRTLLGRRE